MQDTLNYLCGRVLKLCIWLCNSNCGLCYVLLLGLSVHAY
jgi:hypothetical protein